MCQFSKIHLKKTAVLRRKLCQRVLKIKCFKHIEMKPENFHQAIKVVKTKLQLRYLSLILDVFIWNNH